jgi:folate-binding protein YgfZ
MPPLTHSSPDLHEQVLTIRQGVGVGRIPTLGVLSVSGPDALAFLQNRVTNDVAVLAEGQGQYAALLDRKAHIQAYFSLHRVGPQSAWLLMPVDQIAHARQELEKYHIMEQFQSADVSADWVVFGVEGPQSLVWLRQFLQRPDLPAMADLGIAPHTVDDQTIWVVARSFSGDTGFCLLVPSAAVEAIEARIHQTQPPAVLLTEAVREVLRIEAGLPRMGVDFDTETLLPETGLEQVAVSYTKGCYLGQETVARVKTYGSVQKALVGMVLPPNASLPPVDAPCLVNNQPVGVFKSSVASPTLGKGLAMVYLNRDLRVPSKTVSVQWPGGEPVEATVTLLPFYQSQAGATQARALLEEGLKRFAQDQADAAIAMLREALALDPQLADAYESLGVILSRRDQYDEAIALMHKLVELDPKRIMAHTNLSVYYMKIGDKERAEEEKAKALELSMQQAAQDVKKKQDEAAERQKREQLTRDRIDLFQKALALNPSDPLALYGLGTSYLELKQFEEALAPLTQTVTLQPNQSTAYLALGKAQEGAGQTEAARATYEKGIEVASKRGDKTPLAEMQQRLALLQSI